MTEQDSEHVDPYDTFDHTDHDERRHDPPWQRPEFAEGGGERGALRPHRDRHDEAERHERKGSSMFGAAEPGAGHTLLSVGRAPK